MFFRGLNLLTISFKHLQHLLLTGLCNCSPFFITGTHINKFIFYSEYLFNHLDKYKQLTLLKVLYLLCNFYKEENKGKFNFAGFISVDC